MPRRFDLSEVIFYYKWFKNSLKGKNTMNNKMR